MNETIDLIVPVYRPDEKFDKLIEMIGKQTMRPANIFLMQTLTGDEQVDKELTNDLLQIERATVTTLPARAYDHGGTRNKGASMSKAKHVLFMTQDAVPTDEYLIERLVNAMEDDDSVAIAYARQLAGDDVGEIERFTRDFNYPDESRIKSKEDIDELGIKTYFCSNVCALYKKTVYDKIGGFVKHTIFNEDSIYAAKAIEAGYKIAYVSDATVVHAHKYTYRKQFSRNFDLAVSQRQYREIFDSVSSESEGVRLVKDTASHLVKNGKWYMVPNLVCASGAKYMGYFFGKRYEKLPKGLVKKLSMNKKYWER